MDDKLIKRYLKYANSEEALAVLFVKKNLIKAKGHWIDIDNLGVMKCPWIRCTSDS